MTNREIDALVAEKVMGLRLSDLSAKWGKDHPHGKPHLDECAICGEPDHPEKEDHYSERKEIPSYSTDIAAAWEVVEKLKERFPVVEIISRARVDECAWVKVRDQSLATVAEGFADTAPMAICLAALRAVGVTASSDQS